MECGGSLHLKCLLVLHFHSAWFLGNAAGLPV